MIADGSVAAAVGVLLYLNVLPNGFVFDDHPAIEQNPVVQNLDGGWEALLSSDFWGTPLSSEASHHSYRPLASLTLWFNRWLDPTGGACGFHAANVLLHGATVWLLWWYAKRSLGGYRRGVPMLAALLFAVHPLNTEAVAYCVGRADLLAAALGLGGMGAHAAYVRLVQRARCIYGILRTIGCGLLATLLLAAALAAKETALMLLPACAIFDVLRGGGRGEAFWWEEPQGALWRSIDAKLVGGERMEEGGALKANSRGQTGRRLARLACCWAHLGALLLGFVWLRLTVVGPVVNRYRRLDNPVPFEPILATRMMTYARLHAITVRLLLWPDVLSADYSHRAIPVVSSLADPANLGSALSYALVLVLLVSTCRRVIGEKMWPRDATLTQRRSCTGSSTDVGSASSSESSTVLGWLLLLLLTFAPASHVVIPLSFVVAERLLYVPCASACVLAALAHHRLRQHGPYSRHVGRALVAVALIGGGARTARRNRDWANDVTLFGAARFAYPDSAKAIYQIADGLVQRGSPEEAVPLFRRALELEPEYHYAYLHLARLALTASRADEAAAMARASLRAVPSPNSHGHAIAAQALLKLDRAAEATEHAQAALQASPAHETVGRVEVLADALRRQQRWHEMEEVLGLAVRLRPLSADARVNRGAALLQLSRSKEAAGHFRDALQLLPHAPGVVERAQRGLRVATAEGGVYQDRGRTNT